MDTPDGMMIVDLYGILDSLPGDISTDFTESTIEAIQGFLKQRAIANGHENIEQFVGGVTDLDASMFLMRRYFARECIRMHREKEGREPTTEEVKERIDSMMNMAFPAHKSRDGSFVAAGTFGRNKVKMSLKVELPHSYYSDTAREIAKEQNRPFGNWVSWLIIQEVDKRNDRELGLRENIGLEYVDSLEQMAKENGVSTANLLNDVLAYIIGEWKAGNLNIGEA